jgi:hypothetical protein
MADWTSMVRRPILVLAACLALGSFLATCSGEPEPGEPTAPAGPSGPTPTGPTGTGASGPTGTSGGTGPTATASPSLPPPTDLEDGRHFAASIVAVATSPDGGGILEFDLASFLTGEEATEAAREHGDEAPPPNDYYIVNDNPRLRTLAIATDADIRVLDWNRCCDVFVGLDVDAFADLMARPGGAIEIDGVLYTGTASTYWLTLEGGVVTGIEEQYLP